MILFDFYQKNIVFQGENIAFALESQVLWPFHWYHVDFLGEETHQWSSDRLTNQINSKN